MRRNALPRLVLLACLVAGLVSCGARPKETGVVRVFVLTSSQAPLRDQGTMFRLGVQLAADDINAAGGVGGKRLELAFDESGCDSAEAAKAAERAAEDDTVALVLGPLCSQAAHAVEPVLCAADLPAILPVASAEYLAHPSPVLFRMVPSDGEQARLLGLVAAREMGIRRVAVLFENSAYGQVVRSAFGQEAARQGISVLFERPYTRKAAETEASLAALARLRPEAVLLAGDPEMGAVVARTAARLKLRLRFLATSLMAERTLLDLGGNAVEGFTLVEPFVFEPASEAAQQFLRRFQSRFGQRPTWIAASAYDALRLAAGAIPQAQGRKGLWRQLASYNCPERAYQGVTGPTCFDPLGGTLRPVRVVRVENGSFVPVSGVAASARPGPLE